jgi:hypothetical protein
MQDRFKGHRTGKAVSACEDTVERQKTSVLLQYGILNYCKGEVVQALKMVAVCSSESLISNYKSTLCYSLEDENRHLHRHENLNSHTTMMFSAVFVLQR